MLWDVTQTTDGSRHRGAVKVVFIFLFIFFFLLFEGRRRVCVCRGGGGGESRRSTLIHDERFKRQVGDLYIQEERDIP